MLAIIKTSDKNFNSQLLSALSMSREEKEKVDDVVSEILQKVKINGDEALNYFTTKFDEVDVSGDKILFNDDEILSSYKACSDKLIRAIKNAAKRINDYHLRQLPENLSYKDDHGISLGYRWNPINRAGLYVPAGSAPLFSSVLMNVIPARVAGVKEVFVAMPTPKGEVSPPILAACSIAGVDKIYRVGGAQAIAALAYGTERIIPVDIIAGPGNAYVTSAKKQLYGQVGIDMIAGPSEITVVSDNKNDPGWIATDLLAQAEHDTSAQSILITDDQEFSLNVIKEIDGQLNKNSFSSIARESWSKNGIIIIVEDLNQVPPIVDIISPEHLELAIEDPRCLSDQIKNAGAIFLGRYTPEAVGDYIAGPSHVLPTSGTARFSSGLSVMNFLKRTSLIEFNEKSLNSLKKDIVTMAEAEGLFYHAQSVSLRSIKDS